MNGTNEDDFLKDTYVRENGLRYCLHCKTPRETIQMNPITKEHSKLRIKCRCQKEKADREEAERKAREFADEVKHNRRVCFTEKAMRDWTFASADPDDPLLEKAKIYTAKWSIVCREGAGLLFWGGVGSGKTFMAACIANALLDRGIRVLMRNFNQISNISVFDQQEFLNSLSSYSLLILDDLGVERKSEFAASNVFNVVDRWCSSGKPLIVTTNLGLNELKEPKRIEDERIFDRILEMCTPVKVERKSRRIKIAEQHFETIRTIFAGGENV